MRPRGAGARIAQGGGFASGRAVVCAAERNTYGSGAVDAARFEDELAYGGDSRALACALAEPSGGRRGAAQRSPRGRPPGLRLVGEGAPDPALAAFGPAGGGRGSGIVFQRSRLNLTCPVLGAWAVRLISPKRLLWVSLGEKALLGVHAPANMSYLLFRAWCISAQPTVLGSRGGLARLRPTPLAVAELSSRPAADAWLVQDACGPGQHFLSSWPVRTLSPLRRPWSGPGLSLAVGPVRGPCAH